MRAARAERSAAWRHGVLERLTDPEWRPICLGGTFFGRRRAVSLGARILRSRPLAGAAIDSIDQMRTSNSRSIGLNLFATKTSQRRCSRPTLVSYRDYADASALLSTATSSSRPRSTAMDSRRCSSPTNASLLLWPHPQAASTRPWAMMKSDQGRGSLRV